MNAHHKIHLVHNSIFEPFITASTQIGTPIEKILNKVNLPLQLLEKQDILIPERACWEFIREVSQLEGISNFGKLATEAVAHDEMIAIALLLVNCENLFDLLKRFCLVAPTVSDTGNYIIEANRDHVVFKQKGERLLDDDKQVQLFEIAGMIQLVNLATDYQWHPSEIHLTFKPEYEVEDSELLGFSRVLFNQPYPAITIPRGLLALPLKIKHSDRTLCTAIPDEFISKVQHMITPYLSANHLTITTAAELSGTSVRTFQRRLKDHNSNFSDIVDKARVFQASSLLKGSNLKLIDIALSLGYSDASNFTRAFRRWTGVSPKEYRQLFGDEANIVSDRYT